MPYFTLHRTYVLRTTKGHSIGFEKDKPVWVSPICVEDVVAIGAQPVDAPVDVLPPEGGPQVELTPQQREAKLFDAFDVLLLRNERGDFTASNQPHCKKVSAIVDFEVTPEERDEAWRKFRIKRDEAEVA